MANSDLLRRSFRLSGHKTSLSLERVFWNCLTEIAVERGCTITHILDEIDLDRDCPLSRATRLYILSYYKDLPSKKENL